MIASIDSVSIEVKAVLGIVVAVITGVGALATLLHQHLIRRAAKKEIADGQDNFVVMLRQQIVAEHEMRVEAEKRSDGMADRLNRSERQNGVYEGWIKSRDETIADLRRSLNTCSETVERLTRKD